MDSKSFFGNLGEFFVVVASVLFFGYLAASPVLALIWILEKTGVIG